MSPPKEEYKISESPLGTARHVRIITIGAGASGINMIRTLREKLTNYEHVVYEKNPSVGGTCNWKWPEIQGLHDFKGDLLHTANWPKDYEYAGKRVAVIGNGSSGVQVVPALQPHVTELTHFIRSPLWVTPSQQQMIAMKPGNILEDVEMDGDKFTPRQIERFTSDPDYYLRQTAKWAKQMLTQYMTASLGGEEKLTKTLIPDFAVGCRRLTPAVGYLQSLTAKNVRVVTDKITEIVPTGIKISTGEIIEVDALVCATGFDVSFCPRFPIIGRNGNLQGIWTKNLPRAYMSSSIPDFPNYFMFLGPNAPIGHGSVFTITEHVAKYIATVIHKCQTESILSLCPTSSALDDFSEHIDAFMPRTAWASTCRSWFKDGKEDGPVTALHPGSRIHWFHMLESFRGEDFEFRREARNRFLYLGNGFSTKELGDGDKTWYLGSIKDGKGI
ncbi:hypothetical protein G7Y89_g8604 [Cudoniella acicularis]|uniref:Monooxygenase n=1 Tax=Cudoniella acicularis TaxID=354080 RepID=A0A8H4RGA6_9HELO|nr:hypothetical protein G7Y89_g8604 [Cudoniella acicularis]